MIDSNASAGNCSLGQVLGATMPSLDLALPVVTVAPPSIAVPSPRRITQMLAAVMMFAIPWQLHFGVVPDTSWIITMCERVLSGSRLYVDLLEVNPPFTLWMFLPVVAAAHALGLSPEVLVHAYSYAVCILGLGFAALIAQQAGFAENRTLASMLPVFLALLVIFPGNAFSEREHLGVALLLPLLVLMAWRAAPTNERGPGVAIAVLAGLSGSVMLLVKPYYALMIFAPALYVAWQRRSVWMLFAIEYWVIGAACVLYLAAVLHVYPQFVDVVYPLLAQTYMRIGDLPPLLQKYGPPYLFALGALWFLRPSPLSPLAVVFAASSLAATLPLVYQAKGWSYHAFPALVLMVAALLFRTAQVGQPAMGSRDKLLLALSALLNVLPFLSSQKPPPDLVAAIRTGPERPSVALVGSDLAIAFPLTRMVGGSWISAYCSDWLGDMSYRLSRVEERANPAGSRHYGTMFDRYLDTKVTELQTEKPIIVLMQKLDSVWAARLVQRQDFGRFMQDYRLIAQDTNVEIFLRDGAGRPSPVASISD